MKNTSLECSNEQQTPPPPPGKDMQMFFYNIEMYLSVLPVVLMLMGTIGNMVAFYVLTRKKLRTQSTMIYFASLTIMDTMSLYQWLF